jgi:hypothetical protein
MDSYDFAKSMLVVGSHCKFTPIPIPQNTVKPTYTTAFRHEKERNIPCADDGAMTSCSGIKYT